MQCASARRILGDDKIIGVSVSTLEEALQAQSEGRTTWEWGPCLRPPPSPMPCRLPGWSFWGRLAALCASLWLA
jgi:thiamine monophosphate synthase